ncbi:MAG: Ig-like domain-containing protein [Rhodocyclaceae bacterium]|nr:Ig-like domain-containing protein [Rhodocyclaceae bacterium]
MVQDTTAPALTAVADQTVEATSAKGAAVSFTAQASDAVDGSDAVVFKEGNVVVQSGDTFGLGAHTLTASTTDAAGNVGTEIFHVLVQDTTAPTVSSVAATGTGITSGSGDLNAGHVVTLTVNLSEAVTVAGGTPTLILNDGGMASYTGGSGSNALTFNYTVGAGQNTSDLAVTASVLNGATIIDGAGNVADLGAAMANPAGTLQIDTTAPTIAINANIAGDNIINKSEAAAGVSIGGTTSGAESSQTVTVQLVDSSSVVKDTYTTTAGSGTWSVNVTAAQAQALADGSYTIKADVADAAGNPATEAIHAMTVNETAPTVSSVATNGTGITSGSGDLNAGHVVTLTVNLSEVVTVAGGTPTLTLNDGGTATYTGGSGSNALTFSYTVGAGQNTSDLAVTGSALNGATIVDVAGNTADLSTAVANPAGTLQIDTTAPTIAINANIAGDNIINKSEAAAGVSIGGTTSGAESSQTVTVQLVDSSSVVKDTYTTTAGSGTWSVNVTAAQAQALADGSYTIKADVSDAAGNPATEAIHAMTVNETAPTVSSVAATGTGITSGSGDLNAGHVVTLTVNLSEAVTVAGGTPTLTLNDGGMASYTGGSGSNALTFNYTVGAGQNTSDLAVTASVLNGATIIDGAGNVADLGAAMANPAGTLQIDTTAPTVSSVGLTSAVGIQNNILNAGDVVSVTVAASEAVTVTGTPQLGLNIGGTTVQANYASGSGTSALVFTYTIQAGQTDANGISIAANSLSLNGGTIKDTAGNVATLTHAAVTDNGNFLVDTTAPAAPTIPDMTAATDSGSSSTDNITKITTPTFTGTAETGSTVTIFDGTTQVGSGTASGGTYTITTSALSNGVHSITATATDAAGNSGAASGALSVTIDTTAPTVSAPFTLGGGTHNWTLSSTYADTGSGVAQISVTDTTNPSTFTAFTDPNAAGTAGALSGSWTANGTTSGGTRLASTDTVTYTVTDYAGNQATGTTTAPAGIAGEAINLGLPDLSAGHIGAVTLKIAGIQAGWSLSEGSNNGDGSWTVQTDNVGALSITAPDAYAGARVLDVAETWTNADGSTGNGFVGDNVEVYAKGSPIFAVAGDDNLTGSSGHDLFVMAQPIGHDTIYSFDTAADKIDLIGYAGMTQFGDIAAHLADDGAGNAVVTLGDGQTITFVGVAAGQLSSDNFVFDQAPVMSNAGIMKVSDGAMLPLSGVVDNTGTIALASGGSATTLQLTGHGVTLQGGGQVALSDNGANVISGTGPAVTLTNVDNLICGAGQIGAGQMTLINDGTIRATGNDAIVIDTGANVVHNAGTLEAAGGGGLFISGAVANAGLLWADGSTLTVAGAVNGDGHALISGNGTLEFGAAESENVSFAADAAGTLRVDDALDFTGSVAGFNSHDNLDLRDVQFGSAVSVGYAANADATGGKLTVSDGSHTASIVLLGQYDASSFHAAADGGHGTLITYHA